MSLTDDDILKFLRGSPVLFEDVCAVYPAKLGEIVDIGYTKFQQYLNIMIATKPDTIDNKDKEVNKIMKDLSDFQYILLMSAMDHKTGELLKEAFDFFTHEKVNFSLDPPEIIVGPPEEKHLLTEENFMKFQSLIKKMYFVEVDEEDIIIYPDDNEVVVRLKKQMLKNRERVRKAKSKNAQDSKTDLKFSDYIGSITINNCGLNMENIWNITYYAFHDQLKRMGWRDQFNINTKAALAGAKMKKNQLKHWIKSIANSDKS